MANLQQLPLVIQPKNEKQANINYLLHYLKEENAFLKEHLLHYGAILFRGYHVESAQHFYDVIQACSLGEIFNYDNCAVPRTKIRDGIYTSINCHGAYTVPMHSEKSYDPDFPNHIYFNCLRVAETGGNTPLVDNHKLWLALPHPLREKLKSKGIMYRKFYYGEGIRHKMIRTLGNGLHCKTWMDAFQTSSKRSVEDFITQNGTSYRWTAKGNGLITELVLPAFRHHPISNKEVWFNQSDHRNYYYNSCIDIINHSIQNPLVRKIMSHRSLLPYVTLFGDGEPISKRDAEVIHVTIQKNIRSTPWEQGDVIIIDNYACMHGKTPHTGERLVQTGMTK